MRAEKLEGIVLRRSNFSEADRVVVVFTKERGKERLLAKGVRRIKSRRAPHLELFNHVQLSIHQGKTWGIITEAKTIRSFGKIRQNLKLTALAFYLTEVLDRLLPEGVPHPEVFDRLVEVLSEPTLSERQVKDFVIQLLWDLGYLPKGQYPKQGATSFVEEIIERRIGSKKFLEEL